MAAAQLEPTESIPEPVLQAIARIASGEYVSKACAGAGLHRQRLYELVQSDTRIADMYAKAREQQADAFADRICQLADWVEAQAKSNPELTQAQVNAMRTVIDTHKWTASKLRPKLYGDRIDLTVTERNEITIVNYSKRTAPSTIDAAPVLPALTDGAWGRGEKAG